MKQRHRTWPTPRLTGYALWLLASRLGLPILGVAAALDVLVR